MKTYENFTTLDVTPEQIEIMENEMGEWVIDVCDISLYLNDVEPYCGDLKMKQSMEKWFEEHYPVVYDKFKSQINNQYGIDDIAEYINNYKDEIGMPIYYQMCADIYNLHPAFKKFFHKRWEEYGLK